MPRSRAPGIDAGRTPSSASTITAYMDTGSHELTVSGYQGTTGLGVGKFFRSAAFSVGGHTWFILYYPDGIDAESANYISMYLELDNTEPSKKAEIIAQFRLDLLDHRTGQPLTAYTKTSSKNDYCGPDRIWGYDKFIKRKKLEKSNLIQDGSFRICCNVTVFDIHTESTPVRFPASPSPLMDLGHLLETPPELNQHLGALLESKVGGDVTFDVRGEQFTAHRYVLAARSSVLMAELFGPMKENTMSIIQIDDVEPRVFQALLHFIYTDSLPKIDEEDQPGMAQHLLVAGDKYGMQGLKLMCEAMLLKHIDASVLATTLTLAEQHGCHGLKEGCFNFLTSPGITKAVVESDGFQHLRSSCPSLIEEMLLKVAP